MKNGSKLQLSLLLAVVFLTGACVLILEVLSTRILAPYFGNTIFAFSTVIGVTLGALSIGYYAGGMLADRRPYHSWFFTVVLASGTAVFLTKLLSVSLLPWFADAFSLVWGPLAFAIPLFTIPCILMGMLSPYGIRLIQEGQRTQGIGSLSGKVFFWSTLGSIAGTFLAGFVLIPTLGVQSILLGLGTFLLLLGSVGLLLSSRNTRTVAVFFVCWIVSGIFCLLSGNAIRPDVVHTEEGLYESIVVYDAVFNGKTVRFLKQNANPSSAVDLATGEPAFEHMRYYALALALHPDLRNALVIGGGAFTIPQALIRHSSATIDVAEPEPGLRDIARRYFSVDEDERLRTYVTDGRAFLRKRAASYDLIYSDAYQNFHGIPPHLLTQEFFAAAGTALSNRGVFLVNFMGDLSPEHSTLLWSAVRTFRSAFPHSSFFAVDGTDKVGGQNIIFLGCSREECTDPCSRILAEYTSSFLRGACSRQLAIDDDDLRKYALLTDDYNPVEFLAARSL